MLVHMAFRPGQVDSWGAVAEWLGDAAAEADENEIMLELEDRSRAVRTRLAYLLNGCVAGPGGSSRARCSNDRVVRPARKAAPPLSAPARGGYALAIRSVQANHRKVFLIWQRRLHSPNNQLPLWVAWFFTSESDLGHPASSVPSSSSSQARENRRSWHNVAGQMPGAGTGEHCVPQAGGAAWPHAPSGPCVSRQPDENGTAILHSRLFLARCSLAPRAVNM